MWQKNTLSTVLGALLLALYAAAIPRYEQSNSNGITSSKESQDSISATTTTEDSSSAGLAKPKHSLNRNQMFNMLMNELLKVSDFALQTEKALAERLLDDEILAAENSNNMQAMRQNLTKFVRDANEIIEKEANIDPAMRPYMVPILISVKKDALTLFMQVVQHHNMTLLTQPTTEDFLIEEAFKRYGWVQFKADLREHFRNSVETVEEIMSDYFKVATEVEKRQDKDMIDWFGHFENCDMDTKLKLISSDLSLNSTFPLF